MLKPSSDADPIELFTSWLDEARKREIVEHNAMVLSTVDGGGQPSSRVVLLKTCDEQGFVFYTNLESRKGRELDGNPKAALNFFWRELDRQVVVRGTTEPVTSDEADAYFATRPRGSQLGAWASLQSRPLSSRARLVADAAKVEGEYLGRAVQRPPHWSGYRLRPHTIEFWIRGMFRLHDRFLYSKTDDAWAFERLYP